MKKSTTISDSDVPNLPFLQSVVEEYLTTSMPDPFLSWLIYLPVHDIRVDQSFILASTMMMVNMSMISHDKRVWLKPEKFERNQFIEEEVSVIGSHPRRWANSTQRRKGPSSSEVEAL